MIFYNIRQIIRNIRKSRLYSFINILGLALGLAAVVLIILYIQFECSFDNYHKNADSIFRVTRKYDHPGGYQRHFARVPENWINDLPNDYPEIETLVRFQAFPTRELKVGDKRLRDTKWFVVDSSVFRVFDFHLVRGNPTTALSQPHSVVITHGMAMKLFGSIDIMNHDIQLVGNQPGSLETYKITGIMQDLPKNSHFDIHFLASFTSPEEHQNWAYIYILTKPGTDIIKLEDKLPDFVGKYISEEYLPYNFLKLQKLTDIHLYSHLDREIEVNSDINSIVVFSVAAVLILLIACFNFMNLSTAQYIDRVKESGIRKVLGASVTGIAATLTKDFFKCIIIANLLACPVTWFIMVKWLKNYAYRVTINWWIFLLAGLAAFMIAGITVSFQVIRTANSNPVKSLRYE